MNIPKRPRIAGQTWRVTRPKQIVSDGEVCDGLTDSDKRTIRVQRGLACDMAAEVFLHELLHACASTARTTLPFAKEEAFVKAISPLLLGAIRENRLDFR